MVVVAAAARGITIKDCGVRAVYTGQQAEAAQPCSREVRSGNMHVD